MPRLAAKVSEEQLTAKMHPIRNFYGIKYGDNKLLKKVQDDLSKVEFSTENFIDDENYHGIQTVGDLTYFGMSAGGDWEYPIYFIIYLDRDNKTLRGYIPTAGNPWNKTTKQAFGNNYENDYEIDRKDLLKQLKKYKPEMTELIEKLESKDGEGDFEVYSDAHHLFDIDLIKEDIADRISVAG